jgi:hypothetical protein
MLNYYRQQLQLLLTDLKQEVFTPLFLDSYINRARLFVAGETQCIRSFGAITLAPGQQNFLFSSIVTLGPAFGTAGTLNVKMINYSVGTGQRFIHPRAWEWFFLYNLNNPAPATQAQYPTVWSQLGQGVNGTIWINPVSVNPLTLGLDTVSYPINLTTDDDPEGIPVPFTECVAFYAAWLAYQQAQEQETAAKMYDRYKEMLQLTRHMSTPMTNPYIYPQTVDPTTSNLLARDK